MGMGRESGHPERLATLVWDFFLAADNVSNSELLDLDPRLGYVRLGETKVWGPLSKHVKSLCGLRNPNGDLQAVLHLGEGDVILTISEQGREVRWQPVWVNTLEADALATVQNQHLSCHEVGSGGQECH